MHIPEGLRVSGSRIARSIYTLRNKRNIAHKGDVDPNLYDLAYINQSAAWIMAELVRNSKSISMQEAGKLIDLIQAPVGTLVEEIEGVRLIHAKLSIPAEILILLHSHYPEKVSMKSILRTLKPKTERSVRNSVSEQITKKLIFGDVKDGYRLTQQGFLKAVQEIQKLTN